MSLVMMQERDEFLSKVLPFVYNRWGPGIFFLSMLCCNLRVRDLEQSFINGCTPTRAV